MFWHSSCSFALPYWQYTKHLQPMEYAFHSWSVTVVFPWITNILLNKPLRKGYVQSCDYHHYYISFIVAIIIWFVFTSYRIDYPPNLTLIGYNSLAMWGVPLAEEDMYTHSGHLMSLPFFKGSLCQEFSFCVLSFCRFAFNSDVSKFFFCFEALASI